MLSRRGRGRRIQSGGPPWNPLLLTGRTAWFRADQGVTLNTTTVSSWAAIDYPSITFAQATAAKQPLFVAAGGADFGGNAHILWDGVASPNNDGLVGPAWSTFCSTTKGAIFMVMSIDTGYTAATDYCWGFLVGSGLIGMRCVSAGNFNMNMQGSNNTGYAPTAIAFTVDTPMGVMWNHDGATMRARKGNTATSVGMAVATEHANAAATLLTIGYLTGSTAAPPIRVAEMLFSNQTPTSGDIIGWNRYVQNRYGISP